MFCLLTNIPGVLIFLLEIPQPRHVEFLRECLKGAFGNGMSLLFTYHRWLRAFCSDTNVVRDTLLGLRLAKVLKNPDVECRCKSSRQLSAKTGTTTQYLEITARLTQEGRRAALIRRHVSVSNLLAKNLVQDGDDFESDAPGQLCSNAPPLRPV